jgi:hypothetical protein
VDAKLAQSLAATEATLHQQQAALTALLSEHRNGRKFEPLHAQVLDRF